MAREALDVCLRVLKRSSKSRYSVRNSVLIVSQTTSRDCHVHFFFDNLSRWDMIGQYAVPDTVAVESSMSLSLALSNTCPWPLVPFFQISLKNSELKTTHNTFRDCGVHFSENLSRNSCIPNLRSIQSSCSTNFFDRHSCTP